jgi:tetratricopeptide (TPR) repeat protein
MFLSFLSDFQFTLEGRVRKLFQMLRTCIALLVVASFNFAARAAETEDLFQKGLAAYQNRKYDEARDDFQAILDKGTVSARLLHNLALTFYQLNQKPRALALWRKALAVDPSYRAARAGRDMMETRLNMRPFERDSFNLWIRRTLEFISFYELLWLIALVMSIGGWMWIRYYAERRHALDEDRPLPGFPTAALAITTVFVFCGFLTVMKSGFLFSSHATVVVDKAAVRSLPAEDSVSLFEVTGGTEVLIKRQQSGWKQIQNPEGSTGWVKDSDVLISSEG